MLLAGAARRSRVEEYGVDGFSDMVCCIKHAEAGNEIIVGFGAHGRVPAFSPESPCVRS